MATQQVLRVKLAARALRSRGGRAKTAASARVFYFCLTDTHDGVGRVGLGPPVGFFPLFTPEFSQQKKKFSAEITMSTLPKWVI